MDKERSLDRDFFWSESDLDKFKTIIIQEIIPFFAEQTILSQKNKGIQIIYESITDENLKLIKEEVVNFFFKALFGLINNNYFKFMVIYPEVYNEKMKIIKDSIPLVNFQTFPIEQISYYYEELLKYRLILKINHEKIKTCLILDETNRKTTGTFYTPDYIIEYIVENTIGPLIKKKIEGLKKIEKLDPKDILDSILSFRILDPSMGTGKFLIYALNYIYNQILAFYSSISLELPNRKIKTEIINKTIFGIDFDMNAVELAKSLLLFRIISLETNINEDFSFLSTNFVCKNTLFEDILFDNNLKFDVVLGNPPYGASFSKEDKKILKKRFKTISKDSSAYFLEKAINLSKDYVGLIIPKSIAFYSGWSSIREYILTNSGLIKIGDVGIAFKDVNFEELIFILSINKNLNKKTIKIDIFDPIRKPKIKKIIVKSGELPKELIYREGIIIFNPLEENEINLLKKIRKKSVFLKDKDRFVSRSLYIPDPIKKKILKAPLFKFPDVIPKNSIIFINKVPDVERYFIKKYYIIQLSKFYSAKFGKKIEKISRPKIFLKVLRGKRLIAYPDSIGNLIPTEKLVSFSLNDKNYSINFLTAVLNSKIPSWYIQKSLFSDVTETSRVMDDVYLKMIPLPIIDNKNEDIRKKVEIIETIVNKIIEMKIKNENDKEIDAQSEEIERIIAKLYGLNEFDCEIITKYFSK
ncbi:MAG: N-6 DNA methylase [archaeon]|nr:N-6 DNA methylase [archaeon]